MQRKVVVLLVDLFNAQGEYNATIGDPRGHALVSGLSHCGRRCQSG